MKPPSTKTVMFKVNGVWHKGFYLKDANRYVRNVNRWKDTEDATWYDDKDVTEWREA